MNRNRSHSLQCLILLQLSRSPRFSYRDLGYSLFNNKSYSSLVRRPVGFCVEGGFWFEKDEMELAFVLKEEQPLPCVVNYLVYLGNKFLQESARIVNSRFSKQLWLALLSLRT